MKFRKRETFEAVQWFKEGDHLENQFMCIFPQLNSALDYYEHCIEESYRCYVALHPGDWIITHADGTHSVCKAEDFERKYERIEG